MATSPVLAFDVDGRPYMLEFWLMCMRLHLRCFIRDGFYLLEHTSGSLPTPATPTEPAADAGEDVQRRYRADSLAYGQWMERDTVAQRAVRALLPVEQRDHFRQVTSAQTLFDAVVRHYSSLSLATRPLQQRRPLLGEVQPLVEEESVGTCTSASAGGATSGGGGSRGGQQRQQRQPETPSPQQLREWVSQQCVPGSVDGTSIVCGDLYGLTDWRPPRHVHSKTQSGLYTLTTKPAHVAPSGQLVASCSCRLLTHQTLLWHHRLGHPSLPHLRGMHSRLLVSGLLKSLPPLPCSLAPPCLLCVEGRQRAAPHSSSFLPTTAPLQTLHMDVWGPAHIRGQDQERYFLLVVDDYTRYTMVFPLQSKADFRSGIAQLFTLPASPQHNGIAERCIGLIMEVARTFMIHAATPHFQWSFAVQYAAYQLNLWPRVSMPETLPTLHWTGEVGDASAFRVPPKWTPSPHRFLLPQGGDPVANDTAATRRSPHLETPPGFPPRPPSPPPQPVAVDSGAAEGGDTGGADSGGAGPGVADSRGAESGGAGSGGADSGGAVNPSGGGVVGVPTGAWSSCAGGAGAGYTRGTRGTKGTGGAATGGAGGTIAVGTGGIRATSAGGATAGGTGGTGAGGTGARGAGGTRAAGAGDTGATGARGAKAGGSGDTGIGQQQRSRRQETLLPLQLREWVVRRGRSGAGAWRTGAGGTGAGGSGATRGIGGAAAGGAGGTRARGLRGTGAIGAGCTGAGGARGGGAGGSRGTGAGGVGDGGSGTSQPQLPPGSPLPAPSPYPVQTGSLAERREPKSYHASPVRTVSRARLPRPPRVPGMHIMVLCPSSVPQRVALPSPLASSLPDVMDPKSDLARAASPTVTRLLATFVTDPSFESAAASALVTELVDFLATCRLDFVASLVNESESDCPPSVRGELSLGSDVLGCNTYVDEVPPPGANIVDGMWIFIAKRPPGSPPAFKGSLHKEIWLCCPPGFTGSFPEGTQWSLRRPVYGLCQASREWHDTLRTTLAALGLSHSTADPSLFLRTDPSLPPFYVLVYVDHLVFAMLKQMNKNN
ncbi:unnamed protein product [Closterium sp. NIES-53]